MPGTTTRSSDIRLDSLTRRDLTPLFAATATYDPKPVYRALRDEWGPVAAVELSDGVPAWLVTDYSDVVRVLRDSRTFTRDVTHWTPFQAGQVPPGTGLHAFFSPRENAYYTDGRRRERLRQVVDDAFAGIDERTLAREVRNACDRMLSRIATAGTADLVPTYTALVPSLAVATMYGLGPEDADSMRVYATDIFSNTAAAVPAFIGLNTMLAKLIEERRVRPGNDVLSAIVHHENDLTPSELLDTAQMVQSAGHEMAVAWTTMTLVHMLGDANFAGRVHGGRIGVDDALNTVLVHSSPAWNTPCRFVTQDIEIGGRIVHAGEAVVTAVAEATAAVHRTTNAEWSDSSRAYLAFSTGPHHCPADRISRIIVKVAVEQALIRLPGLKLAVPADKLGYSPSLWARSAPTLPVTFQPGISAERERAAYRW